LSGNIFGSRVATYALGSGVTPKPERCSPRQRTFAAWTVWHGNASPAASFRCRLRPRDCKPCIQSRAQKSRSPSGNSRRRPARGKTQSRFVGAAQLLDIKRTTLLSRMDRLDLDPSDYR
jgi:transcriptional regulator with GAF, ATPase, and Fis domain